MCYERVIFYEFAEGLALTYNLQPIALKHYKRWIEQKQLCIAKNASIRTGPNLEDLFFLSLPSLPSL